MVVELWGSMVGGSASITAFKTPPFLGSEETCGSSAGDESVDLLPPQAEKVKTIIRKPILKLNIFYFS